MPTSSVTSAKDLGKEVISNTQPEGTGEYLIYMLVLFMVLFVGAALWAFKMWLQHQKDSKPPAPVTASPPPQASLGLETIRTDLEHTMQLNQHAGMLQDLTIKIKDNTENTKRISEAVDALVSVTEAQSERLLQHDLLLQRLSGIADKQNEIITKYHGKP